MRTNPRLVLFLAVASAPLLAGCAGHMRYIPYTRMRLKPTNQATAVDGEFDAARQLFERARLPHDSARAVLVFTEYTDTLDLCTDAASEGLNLQAAGALINYDLPWNPSRVEERIGRIDRIGQRWPGVRIINLFLADSVDEGVYRVLRERCDLFRHFVGPMQPVLARARRMLLSRAPADLGDLEATARKVEQDPLADGTCTESEAELLARPEPPAGREDLIEALRKLDPSWGLGRCREPRSGVLELRGAGRRTLQLTAALEKLEAEPDLLPLSPFQPELRRLASGLTRPGEHLPLVVGAHQEEGFRAAVAYWVGGGR